MGDELVQSISIDQFVLVIIVIISLIGFIIAMYRSMSEIENRISDQTEQPMLNIELETVIDSLSQLTRFGNDDYAINLALDNINSVINRLYKEVTINDNHKKGE